MKYPTTKVFVAIFFCVFIQACSNISTSQPSEQLSNALPYYKEATFTPHWLSEGGETVNKLHRIGAFKLLNQNGDTITEQTVAGKIHVANFFFTICPGICPKMNANLEEVQSAFLFDDEVLLLSYSVMPTRDSVSVLKAYAKEKLVVSGKWHLLTGDKKQIYNLGRKRYFVEEDLGVTPVEDSFLHSENFVLVDQDGHIRGIYNGLNKTDVNQLIEDIKSLKKA